MMPLAQKNALEVDMIGKGIATVAVWGGVAGLSYLFHSFGILTGGGAGLVVLVGLISTLAIWDAIKFK